MEAKLAAPIDVIFLNGQLAKCPDSAVISLSEKKNGTIRVGELRREGTQVRLWMKHGNSFQLGTAEEQRWADKLVSAFRLDDTPEPEKKQQAEKYRLDDPQFVKKLAALHYIERCHGIGLTV